MNSGRVGNGGFDYERMVWGGRRISSVDRTMTGLNLQRSLLALQGTAGRVLEIGCGAGQCVGALAVSRPDITWYGTDVSLAAVDLARIEYPSVYFGLADAQCLPFGDEVFDAVVFFDVLEHVPDIESTIKEICRVLRPGGTIHGVMPCERNRFTLHWLMWRLRLGHNLKRKFSGHLQRLTTEELVILFERNRLRLEARPEFSYHYVGQIIDVIRYIAKEATLRAIRTFRVANDKSVIEAESINKHTFRTRRSYGLYSSLIDGLSRVAYYESRVLASRGPAIGVHLTLRKPARDAAES